MTTRCPCTTAELRELINAPSSLRQVLAGRVLDARRRGINEKRNAGMPMGKRLNAETAGDYLDRIIKRQLKRDARTAVGGKATHTSGGRDTKGGRSRLDG